jgi:hypothetical protein
MPNTAHILQFTLCELWSRTCRLYLQLRIFRLQYSAEGRSPAIGGISSMQWALYCKLGAKYSAHPPVYAMWTVVPAIYNALTAPHNQNSIFVWTFLRCYCTYHDNSMLVVLQTWCQVQRTSSSLRQSELWPRPCTKYLQLRIFRLQYSSVGVCAAIVDITWIQCAL